MTQSYLSDETIATMSADARRDLIQRLERPLSEVAPPYLARFRALRLGLMIGGSIALIPWITYLAFTLPEYGESLLPTIRKGFSGLRRRFGRNCVRSQRSKSGAGESGSRTTTVLPRAQGP